MQHPNGTLAELKAHVRRQWALLARQKLPLPEWQLMWKQAEAYGTAALSGAEVPGTFVPIPLQGSAAAVLAVPSDADSYPKVIDSLALLPLDETIVVAGRASEPLLEAIRRNAEGALIAHYPFPLDGDVGRALGAKLTGADTVLFVDAAASVPAETLGRFLWECDDGRLDVALPDQSSPKRLFHKRPAVQRWHELLNVTLSRPDLKMNTMAARPFALSRGALDAIGYADLAVPVKAHALALAKRLKVGVAVRMDATSPPTEGEASRLAAGDHIEAWGALMPSKGGRLGFSDRYRDRKAVGGVVNDAFLDSHSDE
ncbi:family 2 glycosyl transferase [Cohnella zeiphila]|uniref:Family 2 glycosyl transferase n=1 Tax=Cohnella zeiphila TaxID=2761120 RepID=A0A7X0W1F4_9BACL|nr:family 2 glycosyl transferase [Cohnella zeiphila]MBB6736013.1 family 2 glycosyl transferase [Cohnella zeiphila]